MVDVAGGDEDGLDGAGFRNGDHADETGLGQPGDDLGAWLQGLSSTERATIDRVERERDRERGREQLGRYARSHPRPLLEGADGGLVDGDAVLDSLIDAARTFEEEQTEAAQYEREQLREALDLSIKGAAQKRWLEPDIAEFRAYIPNGGIKTNRDNEWVVTLHVAWENREEISRVVTTIPMSVKVVMTREES